MQVTVIPAGELTPDLEASWTSIQENHPALRSPSLRPELFRTVGRFNPRAFVAVGHVAGAPVLFFPFQRSQRIPSLAGPVPICDYQSFIAHPEQEFSVREILRACNLKTWTFEHLLAPAGVMGQTVTEPEVPAWRVSLPDGFAAYKEEMRRSGKTMRNTLTKAKLLARDHGDLSFVAAGDDTAVLDRIFAWKADRFKPAEGSTDWIQKAIRSMLAMDTAAFGGELVALYAGNEVVAAHFGIRSQGTLYYWFPAFNPAFSRYTPGWILLMYLLENASAAGNTVVDLGPGGEAYKTYFANSAVMVRSGHVELPSLVNAGRASWRAIAGWVRSRPAVRSALRPLATVVRERMQR